MARQRYKRGKIELNSVNLHCVYHGSNEAGGVQRERWMGQRQLHDLDNRLSSLDYICSRAGQDLRYIFK